MGLLTRNRGGRRRRHCHAVYTEQPHVVERMVRQSSVRGFGNYRYSPRFLSAPLDCSQAIRAVVELGAIKKWEDRNQPSAAPVFDKGDMAYNASYTKPGSSEKRTLFVYGSKDGANSYLLETAKGDKFIADNVGISKRFLMPEVEYKSEGFTFGGGGTGNTKYPLFIR